MEKKRKFKRVRVLCSEDSLRDVLAALLSGNFKSEVPAAKSEAALDFRRVEGDDPYEKPIKRLSSVAKYAGWKYTLPEKKQDLPQDFDSKTEEIYNKYKKFKRDKQLLIEQREECEEGQKTNPPVQRPPCGYSSSYRVRICQGALRSYAEGLS